MIHALKSPRAQKRIFILNHVALVLAIVLIVSRFDLNIPFFGLFVFQYLLIVLAIPLVFGIAAHSMHHLAQKEPRALSLFIVSKLLLLVSIGAYIFIAHPIIIDGPANTTDLLVRIAMSLYIVTAATTLLLPFGKISGQDT